MAAKRSGNETYARISDTGRTLPRVDGSRIAEALGGELAELTHAGAGGPLSLLQIKQELLRRLQSTGGRPSLSGASGRKKIPLDDRQWEDLEQIASELASPGFSPSAGQIASVLLTLALRSLGKPEVTLREARSTKCPSGKPEARNTQARRKHE